MTYWKRKLNLDTSRCGSNAAASDSSVSKKSKRLNNRDTGLCHYWCRRSVTIMKDKRKAKKGAWGMPVAPGGEEGRDKLRKAAGIGKYDLIRGYPNGETRHRFR